MDIDMENRDPNNLNDHLKVAFEDVLGEPDAQHSADCVWRNSYKCFNCSKNCCYMFLTYLCGIPIAFCLGCEFAMLAFDHIWTWTPMLRSCSVTLGCAQKFYTSFLNACCAPICETCGLCFSKIIVSNK